MLVEAAYCACFCLDVGGGRILCVSVMLGLVKECDSYIYEYAGGIFIGVWSDPGLMPSLERSNSVLWPG
jgi:hypothetical protein